MNKSVAVIVVSVVGVVALGGIVFAANRDNGQSAAVQQAGSSTMATDDGHDTMAPKPESNPQPAGTGDAVEASAVTIENYAYSPASIRVKKGTTVTWTNQDSVKHDVMPDKPSDDFKASDLLAKGESYSFTFNTVGTYSYYCSPHPYMKATVEVVE